MMPNPPLFMYQKDTEGYYYKYQTDNNTINFPSLSLLTVYILPFLHKQLVLPFFSGFFAVFSEQLRSFALRRFRKWIGISFLKARHYPQKKKHVPKTITITIISIQNDTNHNQSRVWHFQMISVPMRMKIAILVEKSLQIPVVAHHLLIWI